MLDTRPLAAIMFTDMVGYTALMQENETMARDLLEKNKAIFESCLKDHSGKLLQYYVDGTLNIFNSPADALRCAVEMQTRNRRKN